MSTGTEHDDLLPDVNVTTWITNLQSRITSPSQTELEFGQILHTAYSTRYFVYIVLYQGIEPWSYSRNWEKFNRRMMRHDVFERTQNVHCKK